MSCAACRPANCVTQATVAEQANTPAVAAAGCGPTRAAVATNRWDEAALTPMRIVLLMSHIARDFIVRSVDEAIRRRFHLVPFTVTIPPHERDNQLPEKLKAEGAAIGQWR
jgi:hypothetical protein